MVRGNALVALGSDDSTNNLEAKVDVSNNDTSGTISLTAEAGVSDGKVLEILFDTPYTIEPRVLLTAKDANGASIRAFVEVDQAMGKFTVSALDSLSDDTMYIFDCFIVDAEVTKAPWLVNSGVD